MKNNFLQIISEVSVYPIDKGFFIEVKDKLTENRLAVTREELEKIVLYGQLALKNETEK